MYLRAGIIVKAFPILLATLLTLSSYFLVLMATHNDGRALYSAIFSSTSITVTVGMYAGYYADWLSISMALLCFCFMFRFIELGKQWYLIAASIFFILTNASHTWTWSLMSAGLSLYLLYHVVVDVLIKGQRLQKRKLSGIALILASSLTYDILRRFFVGIGPTGAEIGYMTATSGIKIINLFLLGKNLSYMLDVLVGGLTSNALYFGAAAIGIVALWQCVSEQAALRPSDTSLGDRWNPRGRKGHERERAKA